MQINIIHNTFTSNAYISGSRTKKRNLLKGKTGITSVKKKVMVHPLDWTCTWQQTNCVCWGVELCRYKTFCLMKTDLLEWWGWWAWPVPDDGRLDDHILNLKAISLDSPSLILQPSNWSFIHTFISSSSSCSFPVSPKKVMFSMHQWYPTFLWFFHSYTMACIMISLISLAVSFASLLQVNSHKGDFVDGQSPWAIHRVHFYVSQLCPSIISDHLEGSSSCAISMVMENDFMNVCCILQKLYESWLPVVWKSHKICHESNCKNYIKYTCSYHYFLRSL